MRTDFSPTSVAARRLSALARQAKSDPACTPVAETRWGDGPRRVPTTPPRAGIWQTLQQIQARHA